MTDGLDRIEQAISNRNFDHPPLHLWHPPLSGTIDITIAADGRWFHEGGEIRRDAMVRLFASILRREEDGEYYLVTPVEKWRIEVEKHPLMVVRIDAVEKGGNERLIATLNTGSEIVIGADHPLSLDPDVEVPVLDAFNGLTALFNRNAWYHLVDLADQNHCVTSDGLVFRLAP